MTPLAAFLAYIIVALLMALFVAVRGSRGCYDLGYDDGTADATASSRRELQTAREAQARLQDKLKAANRGMYNAATRANVRASRIHELEQELEQTQSLLQIERLNGTCLQQELDDLRNTESGDLDPYDTNGLGPPFDANTAVNQAVEQAAATEQQLSDVPENQLTLAESSGIEPADQPRRICRTPKAVYHDDGSYHGEPCGTCDWCEQGRTYNSPLRTLADDDDGYRLDDSDDGSDTEWLNNTDLSEADEVNPDDYAGGYLPTKWW